MGRRTASSDPEAGYTLAGLLAVLTVLAVVVAYSYPKMWSDVMRRHRDKQTIWTMKQYARSIEEFQRRRGTFPSSLEELEKQNNPRVLRRLYPDPLTGEMDWILVPQGTPSGGSQDPNNTAIGGVTPPTGSNPPAQQTPTPGTGPDGKPAGGPFVGVRPPITGKSFLKLHNQDQYEKWLYTVEDLQRERAALAGAALGQPNPSKP